MKPLRVDDPGRRLSRDLRLSLVRNAPALPWRCDPPPTADCLAADQVLSAARGVGREPGAFLLGGGNPLQRSDLFALLREIARMRPQDLGICTLGYGVDRAQVENLRDAGVRRVNVAFHSARQDAHDWLVGQSGALKAAHRAIRACLEADMPVEIEIVLTRPTVLPLAETVEVLTRIGVRKICVRRLTAVDIDGPGFVSLSPRLFLVEKALEEAAAVALRQGVRLVLRDLPLCVAPRLRPLFAAPDGEAWVMPDGAVEARMHPGQGCASCPGLPRCAGAPPDYVARFGWEEMATSEVPAVRVHETVGEQQAYSASPPMSFTWSGPSRVTCPSCGDRVTQTSNPAESHEPTRPIRARLVQAAHYRPSVLRLVGADILSHPDAARLIHDALRLFRHVEVAGEASAVADWSDLDLRRLKDLRRVDVALYGPDAASHDAHCGIPGAFEAMQRGVERLRANSETAVEGYAIVHDASMIPSFAAAWERGALPGPPRFRLSAQGGSLDDLVQCARALAPGAARTALVSLLPRCLCEQEELCAGDGSESPVSVKHPEPRQWIHQGRSMPYQPCGSDPFGSFEACPETQSSCVSAGCPGTATGWYRATRSTRWTASL